MLKKFLYGISVMVLSLIITTALFPANAEAAAEEGWLWPVIVNPDTNKQTNRISSPMQKDRVINGVNNPHRGIDIPNSNYVVATKSGKIVHVTKAAGEQHYSWAGVHVVIEHYDANGEPNFYSRYQHMALNSLRENIKVGAWINQGDIIGTAGYTGQVVPADARGTHLHFEIGKKLKSKSDPQIHSDYLVNTNPDEESLKSLIVNNSSSGALGSISTQTFRNAIESTDWAGPRIRYIFEIPSANANVVPTAPTNLYADIRSDGVRLSWYSPENYEKMGIVRYEVSLNGTTWETANDGILAHTFKDLEPSVYTFWVRAVNGSGSGTSATLSFADPRPSVPQGLVATTSDGEIAISWNAPAYSGSSGITGYRLYVSTGETPAYYGSVVPDSNSSHVIRNLANGTKYNIWVNAVNDNGGDVNASWGARAKITAIPGTQQAPYQPITTPVPTPEPLQTGVIVNSANTSYTMYHAASNPATFSGRAFSVPIGTRVTILGSTYTNAGTLIYYVRTDAGEEGYVSSNFFIVD